MKLTSKNALEMLEEAEKIELNTRWVLHSKCVGDTAGKIAKALNIDVDKAKTLGYIQFAFTVEGFFRT